MASFSKITFALPLLMLTASCYCASYEWGGTFGAESHLNLTSTGFGTLKSNDTANSGIGGVWNATVYGGGFGNHDNVDVVGAVASAKKVVSLKPGDSIWDIKSNDTTYGGKLFVGENATRLAESIRAGDTSLIRDDDSVEIVDTSTKASSD